MSTLFVPFFLCACQHLLRLRCTDGGDFQKDRGEWGWAGHPAGRLCWRRRSLGAFGGVNLDHEGSVCHFGVSFFWNFLKFYEVNILLANLLFDILMLVLPHISLNAFFKKSQSCSLQKALHGSRVDESTRGLFVRKGWSVYVKVKKWDVLWTKGFWHVLTHCHHRVSSPLPGIHPLLWHCLLVDLFLRGF